MNRLCTSLVAGTLVALFAVLPGAAGEKTKNSSAAEKLYRTMEKRFLTAKTVEMKFQGEFTGKEQKGELKGSLILAKGNRIAADFQATFAGKTQMFKMRCDGKKCVVFSKRKRVEEPKKNQNRDILQAMVRFGPAMSFTSSRPDDSGEMKESEFQLGKKEKVGDRQTQILRYKIAWNKERLQTTVWIDLETGLPLKRVTSPVGEGFRMSETLTGHVNRKIDPKVFDAPE